MSAPSAPTPGQTVGPFFHYALPYDAGNELVPPTHPDAIRLHGRVFDGSGALVPDALIEIWQADPSGTIVQQTGSLARDGWTFTGWGRAATDNAGHYSFSTFLPGATEAGSAPFFAVTVFARGLLNRLFTRAYLPSGEAALAADPLLTSVGPSRRGSLMTTTDALGLVFDVHLQGDRETVFLRYPGH